MTATLSSIIVDYKPPSPADAILAILLILEIFPSLIDSTIVLDVVSNILSK